MTMHWRDLKIARRAPHHVGIWSASASRQASN